MSWSTKFFGSTDITVDESTGAIRTRDDSLSTIIESLTTDGRLKVDASGVADGSQASELVCGTKTVSDAATPEPLVFQTTPCKGVLVMAPCSAAGLPTNTSVAFIGNDTTQNIPIIQSNLEGVLIQIDDAVKLYVKVGVNGESVNYVIFK